MLSEIGQTKKDTVLSHLYVESKIVKHIEVENGGGQGLGWSGNGEVVVKGYKVSLCKLNKFWISPIQHKAYG